MLVCVLVSLTRVILLPQTDVIAKKLLEKSELLKGLMQGILSHHCLCPKRLICRCSG